MKMKMCDIVIKTELRPCVANGKKALFQCREQYSAICSPSLLKGGHNGGIVRRTYAIVEFEDGIIKRFCPEEIKFTDNKFDEYVFTEDGEENVK